MKIKLTKKNSILGQSIIEVIVALSLVVIVVLGLVKVTVVSINNAGFANDQRAATKYAQDQLENARKEKEEHEAIFWAKSGTEEDTIGKFDIKTTYTPLPNALNPDKMNIQVIASWEDSKGTHESKLETYLTKWK